MGRSEAYSDLPCTVCLFPFRSACPSRRWTTTAWRFPCQQTQPSDVSSCTSKREFLLLIRIWALHLLPLAGAELLQRPEGGGETLFNPCSYSANTQLLISTHE